jgi:hypothetical protein
MVLLYCNYKFANQIFKESIVIVTVLINLVKPSLNREHLGLVVSLWFDYLSDPFLLLLLQIFQVCGIQMQLLLILCKILSTYLFYLIQFIHISVLQCISMSWCCSCKLQHIGLDNIAFLLQFWFETLFYTINNTIKCIFSLLCFLLIQQELLNKIILCALKSIRQIVFCAC